MQVTRLALLLVPAFATAAAGRGGKRPATLATCHTKRARATSALLDGSRVVVCFDLSGPRTCWGLDITTAPAPWVPLPPTTIPAVDACAVLHCDAPPTAKLSTVTRVTVCAPDQSDCHTVSVPPLSSDPLPMVTSDDRARLAVVQEDVITTFDTHTGHRAATIAAWKTPDTHMRWTFASARFLTDERLLVVRTDARDTLARIINASSGATMVELADGANLDRLPTTIVGSQVAVATFDGAKLVLYQRDSGTTPTRSVSLFGTVRGEYEPHGLALLVGSDRAHAVVAVRSDGDGAVAIYDAATGLVRIAPGPASCP